MGASLAYAPLGADEFYRWAAHIGPGVLNYRQSRQSALQRGPANNFSGNLTDVSHVVTSDAPTASEQIDMDMRTSIDGNGHAKPDGRFQTRSDRNTLIDNMGQDDLTLAFSNSLREAFGETNAAVKRIAAVANCNERAARNWLEGRNPPTLLYAMRLMAHVPQLQGEMRRLAAMESSLDPNFERAMSQAIQLFQQAAGRGK